MDDTCDIAIVGAGAAGLAAAIFAAEAAIVAGKSPLRIVLVDGAKTIGAKILVSGGGRCNVTHDRVVPDDYQGSRNIVRNILAAFNERTTVKWFESIGVPLKREETGKLFPVTNTARAVLAALVSRAGELGIELRSNWRVLEIVPPAGDVEPSTGVHIPPKGTAPNFIVQSSRGKLAAKCVILCTGGKSLPRTGSDGFGWDIVRRLGHSVSATFPALVPLVLEDKMFHAGVSGLSHEAELSTFVQGKRVDRRTGSLLWTHFGISGPGVMDASRFWTIARGQGLAVEMLCNFLPGRTFEQLDQNFIQLASARPKLSIVKAVAEHFPERLAEALLRYLAIDPAQPIGQLSRDNRRVLVRGLTALALPIIRDRGWNYAEVTAGGVPLAEIDYRTMASRKTPGLFLCGEILDCDGRIGGFNFQWAWATGYLAGRGAVARI